MTDKRLHLSSTDKKISGVCGGLAEYFEIDSTVIRLIWALLTVFSFAVGGVVAYIVAAVIIPEY
ncbi:MAG: PspC domain-containing protein [Firmicutes bacterium]|nr:PspC domain-containing protein [Bacillota bacterium]